MPINSALSPKTCTKWLRDEQLQVMLNSYNLIRAGISSSLEESHFTSIKERINQYKSHQRQHDKPNADYKTQAQPKSLLPFAATLDTQALPFSYSEYFELVDWSGRHIDPKKTGYISHNEPNILNQLGIESDDWLTAVKEFRRQYGSFAGGEYQLRDYPPTRSKLVQRRRLIALGKVIEST